MDDDSYIKAIFPFRVEVFQGKRDISTIERIVAASHWATDNKGFGALWMESVCIGNMARWTYKNGLFYFKSESDAVEFKLHWG